MDLGPNSIDVSAEVDLVAGVLPATLGRLPLTPGPRRAPVMAPEGGSERIGRAVAGQVRDFGQVHIAVAQVVAGQGHSPIRQILHWSLAERVAERPCESGA